MSSDLRHLVDDATGAIRITAVTKDGLGKYLEATSELVRAWVASVRFKAEPGATCLLPGADGRLSEVLLGVSNDEPDRLWTYAALPGSLPEGTYALAETLDARRSSHAALGWALGTYAFGRYKTKEKTFASLAWPSSADRRAVASATEATFLVRRLIDTPTEDMGPEHLADAAVKLAGEHGAQCAVLVGDELLLENYPMIHAVGRASPRAPRLIDLRWGDEAAPKVTLVGKGVCFDSGGLDIKPASSMLTMKKDMGGAAHVLGVAHMVMAAKLPVRLRVLVPAVENVIAGNAYRPLDVFKTRKGLTVEITNTDAEGRLVLCDALAEADREAPATLIDFATLTGAARVALGAELPAMFTPDDSLADALLRAAKTEVDPMWRLPLWKGYRKSIDGKVADLANAHEGGQAGAIVAALFLQQFVSAKTSWAHIDLGAWNGSSKPGRPEGGEAQTLRAVFAAICERHAPTA